MPHKDRDQRLACIRDHHRKHRPSPTPVPQANGLPPHGQTATTDDKIQCHECGRWLGSLPLHITRVHHMTVDDYKYAHGLSRNTPLWSPATIEKQRAAALARDQGAVGRKQIEKIGQPDPSLLRGVARRLQSRVGMSQSRVDKPKPQKDGNPPCPTPPTDFPKSAPPSTQPTTLPEP